MVSIACTGLLRDRDFLGKRELPASRLSRPVQVRFFLVRNAAPANGLCATHNQFLVPVLAKSGAWACRCSVTALRINQATETRFRSERRLSSRYSSAGKVTDSRVVEGFSVVFLGSVDMVTSYHTIVVHRLKDGNFHLTQVQDHCRWCGPARQRLRAGRIDLWLSVRVYVRMGR